MASSPVFLDANVIIYGLDQTSEPHEATTAQIQQLLEESSTLCTSHHVIEEVLHVVQKLPQTGITPTQVVSEIADIPDLVLVEPAANIEFASRYAALSERLGMGINDALLLQLMIDSGINRIFTYDKKFSAKATSLGFETLV